MKNLIKPIFFLLPALWLQGAAFSAFGQGSPKDRATIRAIVIDAGHGGKDPGTVHGSIYEKDITLKVALLLGAMIRENLPGVEVVYTRKTDVFVELTQRSSIANRVGADLFLSIHVDALKSPLMSGNSTFVMGMDKSNANLDVAMRENDVVSLEENYTTKYEGYIPGSVESFIIFSLMQYAYQGQSMNFAQTIQKHYQLNTPITDRGARQAPYLVLWKTAMPSVLTEIGFLSNESDRKFVTSEVGQKKIARALFNAFSEYKSSVEGLVKTVLLPDIEMKETSAEPTIIVRDAAAGAAAVHENPVSPAFPAKTATAADPAIVVRDRAASSPATAAPDPMTVVRDHAASSPATAAPDRSTAPITVVSERTETVTALGSTIVQAPANAAPHAAPSSSSSPSSAATRESAENAAAWGMVAQAPADTRPATFNSGVQGGITFAVQLGAATSRISPNDSRLANFRGQVTERRIGGMYKYFVYEGSSYQQVSRMLYEVRRTVKDAFMAAFRNGEPISVTEAMRLTNQ